MSARHIITVISCAMFCTLGSAADIRGTIIVKHRLTKRKVTPLASSYQRGAAVDLGSGTQDDPLTFERTHVVVYLEGQRPSRPVTATMAQENRQFVPDLLVIPAGSMVSFPNQDPIFHNVFSLSKSKAFDLGNYPKGQTRTVQFSKPGIVLANCYLHPNMGAVIVVAPNQWYARADKSGHFVLRDVPDGEYTIVAWHKTSGFFRQQVQVPSDRSADVQFLIPLDEHGLPSTIARN